MKHFTPLGLVTSSLLGFMLILPIAVFLIGQPTEVSTRQKTTPASDAAPAVKSATDETPTTTAPTASPALTGEGVVEAINVYRKAQGQTALVQVSPLTDSACAKANDMVAEDYWAHVSPKGQTPWYFIKQAGYMYKKAAENLANGYTSSQAVVDGWIASRAHLANMVGNYSEVGVCVVRAHNFVGEGARNVIVAHFGSR